MNAKLYLYIIIFCSLVTSAKANVVISEVMYDTPLNEVITAPPYSNGEFIKLSNWGSSAVDISSWRLQGDGVTEVFNFPAGTVLLPHADLIVAYQCNNSNFTLDALFPGISLSSAVLYQRKIILANSGETVSLKDQNGVLKDMITYDGTSNKRDPYRLSADNEDGALGYSCFSLQRKTVSYDGSGGIAFSRQDWVKDKVVLGFSPGIISGSQVVSCTYASPLQLENVESAHYGSNPINYQWERRIYPGYAPYNGSWTEVAGATDAVHTPRPVYDPCCMSIYRRAAISEDKKVYSNEVEITYAPPVFSFSIQQADVVVAKAGGWYHWDLNLDHETDTACMEEFAFSVQIRSTLYLEYTLEKKGFNIFFPLNTSPHQRNVTIEIFGPGDNQGWTQAIQQAEPILPGNIKGTQTVVCSTCTQTITSETDASCGANPVSYRWEQNTGGGWLVIPGAMDKTYLPIFSQSAKYRRGAVCEGLVAYSNEVEVTSLVGSSNFIITYTPTTPSTTITQDVFTSITHYDGLGRLSQTSNVKASPTSKDLVQLQEYDAFGNPNKRWNTVAGNSGGAALTAQQVNTLAQAQYEDANPYSLAKYEPSPLNRLVAAYGPGQDWHANGKAVSTKYLTNAADGELVATSYSVNANGSLQCHGPYQTGSLYVTRVANEDGQTVWEFKDKQKRLVLTRMKNGGENHDTYYVYNELGQKTYVLPPLAADAVKGAGVYWLSDKPELNLYAYHYKYDHHGRCVERKIPGTNYVKYLYDDMDRIVAQQDGVQKHAKEWLCTNYDELGRIVKIGLTTVRLQVTKPGQILPPVSLIHFDKDSLGNIDISIPLVQNFYDWHNFTTDAQLAYVSREGFGAQHPGHQGLPTGMAVDAGGALLYTTLYYDAKGNVVQSHTQNHLGGYDHHYYAYSFTGQVLRHRHEHSAAGKPAQAQEYAYAYDHAGRLLTVKHALNGNAEVTLAQNAYDELGRLLTKKQGGNLATTGYSYNVRGWLTAATGSHFSQQLHYQRLPQGLNATPSYSGNVSAMTWQAANNVQRGYAFDYDQLSRLKKARYGEDNGLTQNANRYNEELTYDAHGNIESLTRHGVTDKLYGMDNEYGLIDHLDYEYHGNQLKKITDYADSLVYSGAADFNDGAQLPIEYRYDPNGNMTYDANKGITNIAYNYLNLPLEVTFKVGHKYLYTHSATGAKLRVVTVTNENAHLAPLSTTDEADLSNALYHYDTTDYCAPYIYKNGKLNMLLTEEGYVSFDTLTGMPMHHYFVKDHLGSNRVVLSQSGTVEQVNHYYPFGMEFNEQPNLSEQPYKYGGKEYQSMHRLDLYDSHKRQQGSALPGFTSIDPLAEKYYDWSPYVAFANNPVRNIDLRGDSAWSVIRDWNESDIQNFTAYTQAQLQKYEDQNIDCADLSLSILIDYASENGLALNITTEDGRSFDSNSDNYNNVDDYKNGYENKEGKKEGGVLPNVKVTDIPSNTFIVDKANVQTGDMMILTAPVNHIVNFSQTSPTRKLTYGNLTGGKPSAVKTTSDWTNVTTDSRGVVYRYNPNNKTVHRWNYLNPKK